MRRWVLIGIVVLAIAVLASSVFTLNPRVQAVVLQFGEPVRAVSRPGPHLRIPFIQSVQLLPNTVLFLNAEPEDAISQDKRTIIADYYVVWRIDNPLDFVRTMGTVTQALIRLDDVVFSSVRQEISRTPFDELIVGRKELTDRIVKDAQPKLEGYGISLMDVEFVRLELPQANQQAVFDRMRSERDRIAQQERATGNAEATRIRAETDRQVAVMVAEANRQAQEIMGKADAEATRIYAEAYGKDASFYGFWVRLQTLQEGLKDKTTLVIDRTDPIAQTLMGRDTRAR